MKNVTKSPRTLLLFIIMAFVVSFAAPAKAQDDDALFTVEHVPVDVTDKDAVTARAKALPQAEQEAFRQLAEKLMTPEEMAKFKAPDDATVATMVKDFEVESEQLSNVRYVATYTLRFRGAAVRAYLGKQNVSYTDVVSKPLLVLPFYQWGSRTILWGNDNPWLAAWTRIGPSKGLVPLAVPMGDAQDVADLSDSEAFTYERSSLKNMVGRYNAGEAAIALATAHWDSNAAAGQPPRQLDIQIYRTDRSGPEFVSTLKVEAQTGDDGNAIYNRGVEAVRKALQRDWKARIAANPASGQGTINKLKVRVRFAGMQQWVETQKALRAAAGISDVKVLSLKPDAANVEFAFEGSEDRLRLALQQADITLSSPQVDFAGGQPLVYDLYLNKYTPGFIH